MATTKKRLNITLSSDAEAAIMALAAKDKVPAATKVRDLLEQSLVLLEDEVLSALADARMDKKPKKTLSHSDVWDA